MLNQLIQGSSTSPAIWMNDIYISYQDFASRIKDVSKCLLQQGIQKGARVAFIAKTDLHSILVFFALLELEASPCPLSTRIPIEQVPVYTKQARASFFLNTESFQLDKMNIQYPSQENAILLFTSGSTGSPKLVCLHFSHFLSNAKGSSCYFNLKGKESCWLLSVPLFHVSGLSILFRSFLTGSSIVLSENLLQGHHFATHISLVPTQLLRIIQHKTSFPKLLVALIGGAPISTSLIQLSTDRKIPVVLTYGMTEMASQITMTQPGDSLFPIHLGKALPNREISIDENGEILVKGSCLFDGYDSPSGPSKKLLQGEWFQTGDLGAWNQDNNLEYKGRKDNLFISGGENIYPEEIERALKSIPGILEAIVVPLQDSEFGQRPVAFIHMLGNLLSKEEFLERLSPLLPRFCLPIHFFPFPQEELNKNSKIKRSNISKWLKTIHL